MNNQTDDIELELFDASKQPHKYILLDIVHFNDNEYVVLLPKNSYDKQVEIFRTKHSKDLTETTYEAEKDNYIVMQVYEIFKEKYQNNFKGRIKFVD